MEKGRERGEGGSKGRGRRREVVDEEGRVKGRGRIREGGGGMGERGRTKWRRRRIARGR